MCIVSPNAQNVTKIIITTIKDKSYLYIYIVTAQLSIVLYALYYASVTVAQYRKHPPVKTETGNYSFYFFMDIQKSTEILLNVDNVFFWVPSFYN